MHTTQQNQAPRTSIIMPVYGTEATVVRAIESVQAQTDSDWELIVVIDASPDGADGAIREHLSGRPDARVKVTTFSENRGVSAARNAALQAATGQWIAFLDSDDAYEPDFLESLHSTVAETNSDIGVCAHKVIATDGAERVRLRANAGCSSGRDALVALLHDAFTPYLWDKLFSSRVIEGLRFSEEIHRAEDALFVLQALLNARQVSVIENPLYRYSIDAGGLTWGRVTPVTESDRLTALMAEATRAYADVPQLRDALTVSKVLTYLNNAQQVLVAEPDSSGSTLKEIRQRISIREALTCLRARPVFGAAALLLKTSPSLYRVLYGAYIKRRYGVSMRAA
ncbi:glycosyltransferase family 2 protein [Dermabacter sp. Marseille-Q3180]|uniref:glycosyltransferase family 2 protein n=1 Tax=Dermabacter sp. Marseille-Q3180 TaxID=2758090 RepID=UPI002024CA1E|nr:glycosyltransferase family 2 protein [Dermabacter sp. Marseille-Q3180]